MNGRPERVIELSMDEKKRNDDDDDDDDVPFVGLRIAGKNSFTSDKRSLWFVYVLICQGSATLYRILLFEAFSF